MKVRQFTLYSPCASIVEPETIPSLTESTKTVTVTEGGAVATKTIEVIVCAGGYASPTGVSPGSTRVEHAPTITVAPAPRTKTLSNCTVVVTSQASPAPGPVCLTCNATTPVIVTSTSTAEAGCCDANSRTAVTSTEAYGNTTMAMTTTESRVYTGESCNKVMTITESCTEGCENSITVITKITPITTA